MELVERVRALLPDAVEKRMFRGTAFMVDGALAVSVNPRGLLVRVGRDAQAGLVEQPGVEAMTMRGRVSRGWVEVAATVVEDDAALREWVRRGTEAARSARA